jgi:hypothetical protein
MRGRAMTKKKGAEIAIGQVTDTNISEIASHYLGLVGGADPGMFTEFMQFKQGVGEPGGPAEPGGSYWMEIKRTRPLEMDGGI